MFFGRLDSHKSAAELLQERLKPREVVLNGMRTDVSWYEQVKTHRF